MKKINNLKLYHIHDEKFFHSNLWTVGNSFIIDNNFDNLYGNELDGLDCTDALLSDDSVFRREIALEEVRKNEFPHLMSRYHCIWLCDDISLKYWSSQLPGDVFLVNASGIIFESSDNYLYTDMLDYDELKVRCRNYWTSAFNCEEDINRKEILFQGKIKVLERIDNNGLL